MPSFVSSSLQLRDSDTKSLSLAQVEVLQSLAGRVRLLAELVTGYPCFREGEPLAIPKNPQDLYGLDFSGPPWGSAWRHPTAWQGGLKPDTAGAGDWEGHRTVGQAVAGSPLTIPIRLWNRAHEQAPGAPYSRAFPVISIYQAAAVATYNVAVICRSVPGSTIGDRQELVSVSSVNETIRELSVAWFDLAPGRNDVELVIDNPGSTAAIVASWSINPTAKRSY